MNLASSIVRAIAVASVFATTSTSYAAATTNYTDQWWNAGESGWGAAATQQGDTIFFDLFVYGPSSAPIWYTAAATFQATTAQGHLVFSGDLYVTNGPYFGGSFNPSSVTSRKVGTLTFDADSVNTARLTYSVDGVTVTKQVSRQLWRLENFTGDYYGGLIYDSFSCINGSNGTLEELASISLSHNANGAISMAFVNAVGTSCNFSATYSQAGHMGAMQGSYSCSNGISGVFNAFEMEKTISGFSGRFTGQNNLCEFTGHMGGVLR